LVQSLKESNHGDTKWDVEWVQLLLLGNGVERIWQLALVWTSLFCCRDSDDYHDCVCAADDCIYCAFVWLIKHI
jgi:hypothetical protein